MTNILQSMSDLLGQPLMTVNETSKLLNISTRTLYTLVEYNEVPHTRIGGQIRFVPRILEQWIENGGADGVPHQ